MSDLRARILIDLTGNLESRAKRYSDAMGRFSERGQRQMSLLSRATVRTGEALDGLAGRYTGMIVGAGAAYLGTRAIMQSGQLDKQLIRIRQTAGATEQMASLLRSELHAMAEETGQSVDSLLAGFNNLIQAGQSWDQALVTIKAINPAMAVTGAGAEVLSSALTVAGEAFKFDLSQPKLAVELLDQMTAAGRLGNAELEDLSSIFARVGVNAKAAGLDFAGTLGFIEQLSLIEKNPERLATLADSTLRLFTNQKYLEKAAKATGVTFYDGAGNRREAFDVLADIAKTYKGLKGDLARDTWTSAAFGEADLDTIKGLRALLSGDAIAQAREMSRTIAGSGGTIARDLPGALKNSVDQVERLKNALHEAADGFSRPINDTIARAVKFLLDEKHFSGGEIMAGSAAAAIAGLLTLKGGGRLLQRLGGTGGRLVAGKALEEFSGVQPVYVVNMPGGGIPVPGGSGGSSVVARSGVLLAGAPLVVPIAASGAAMASEKIGKALARSEARATGTDDLLALRGRQMVMGGGPNSFQVRTIDQELARRDGAFYGKNMQDMAAHKQQPLKGEVVVRVRPERGAEARTERPSSNSRDISLQAETEVGFVSGGRW